MTFYLQKEWCFMFNKKLTKLLACFFSASCLLATTSSITVSADETIGDSNTNAQVFVLNEEDNGQPPIYYGNDGIMPCGEDEPSYNTTLWNLSYTNYGDGEVKASFKHEVYTSCCFTFNGDTAVMHVVLNGNSLLQYCQQYPSSHYIDFELHEYYTLPLLTGSKVYDRTVETKRVVNSSPTAGVVFSGLQKTNSSTSRYYVKFSKPKDGFELLNVDVNISLI